MGWKLQNTDLSYETSCIYALEYFCIRVRLFVMECFWILASICRAALLELGDFKNTV